MYLMLLEALPIFLKATLYYHQSSLQGAGNRRRMQLSKCVYSHRLTAAAYIPQTCSGEEALLSCVCVWAACIMYASLNILVYHCYSVLRAQHVLHVSPVCEYRSTVFRWSVSHGDSITWPQSNIPVKILWVFPKIPSNMLHSQSYS